MKISTLTLIFGIFFTVYAQDFTFGTKQKLGTGVNTIYEESNPIVSADGNTLYFARFYYPQNTGGEKAGADIWVSTKKEGEWSVAKPLPSPVNNVFENIPFGISEDGKRLYVSNIYLKNGKMKPGLSVSEKLTDSTWSMPKEVIFHGGYKVDDAQLLSYNVSHDEKNILIARYASKPADYEDVFISHPQGNTWSHPTKFNDIINSTNIETLPCFVDDSTFVFASNINKNSEELDMYITKRVHGHVHRTTKPEKLAINTSNFEGGFTTDYHSNGYFASCEDANSRSDIYILSAQRSFNWIHFEVFDAQTKKKMTHAELFVSSNGARIISTNIHKTKKIKIAATTPEYTFTVLEKGYLQSNFSVKNTSSDTTILVYLDKVEVGKKLKLKYIYFESKKSELLKESENELSVLLRFMTENPTVKIKIEGHTDNVGTHEDNIALSENRVKSVIKYLEDNKIDVSRIKFEGYGETKPLASNDTEDGRSQNRRVEFLILQK